ncbi:hypothetical protein ABPG75_009572 [Micractinium tetrahymenae]
MWWAQPRAASSSSSGSSSSEAHRSAGRRRFQRSKKTTKRITLYQESYKHAASGRVRGRRGGSRCADKSRWHILPCPPPAGAGDMAAYDPQCLFADPFAGFNGVERFQRNVSNLGGLMQDIRLDILSFEEGEQELRTRWRFSATLDLPWRPILAAAGGTTHVFDPDSGLVVKHIESWDVEPARVVKQLLKPSAKIPATQWEVLMSSVHDGDILGIWFALSSKVASVALPLSAALAMLHLLRGEGLGGWEAACYLGAVGGLATELWKVVRAFIGGESG